MGPRRAPSRPGSTSTGTRTYPGLAGKVLVPFLGDQLRRRRSPTAASRSASTRPRAASRSGRTTPTSCRSARATTAPSCAPAASRAEPRPSTPPRRATPAIRRWSELEARLAAPRRPGAGARRLRRAPRRPASWSRARRADRRAALAAGEVQPRRRRDQLPPLLHHQRPRRRPRRAAGGLRGDPRAWSSRLLDEGLIDGLRIDHIDGLRDPKAYSAAPARRVAAAVLPARREDPRPRRGRCRRTGRPTAPPATRSRTSSSASSSTRPAPTRSPQTYADFTGRAEPPAEVVHAAKREILAGAMAGRARGARRARLARLAARDAAPSRPRPRRAAGRRSSRSIAALDVYRTYADADGIAARRPRPPRARRSPRRARRSPGLDPDVFDFLEAVLTLDARPAEARGVLEAALRAAAAQRPGDGQGPRGHRALPLQPPDRAQRGRQRARARSPSPSTPSTAPTPRAWPRTPARAARHLDPRHQARRGRPRPHRRARRPRRGLARARSSSGTTCSPTRPRRSTATRSTSSTSSCSAPGRPSGGDARRPPAWPASPSGCRPRC